MRNLKEKQGPERNFEIKKEVNYLPLILDAISVVLFPYIV